MNLTEEQKEQLGIVDERVDFYFKVENAVIDDEMFSSASEALLFIVLSRYCNNKNYAFPSLNTLAKKCYCSRPTVVKCLNLLIEKKLIKKVGRENPLNGATESNLYAVCNVKEYISKEKIEEKKAEEILTPCKAILHPPVKQFNTPCKIALPNKEQYINNNIKKETCNMSSDNLKTELELNPKGYPQKDKWEKFLNKNLKGIDYIPSIQAAIKNLEQNLSQTEIERYLLENYTAGLKQNLNLALIAKTISKGERIKTQETSIDKNISPEKNICLTRKQKIEQMKNNLDSRTLETIKIKIAKQLLEEMNISEESTILGELENYLVAMWNKTQQTSLQ